MSFIYIESVLKKSSSLMFGVASFGRTLLSGIAVKHDILSLYIIIIIIS